MAAADSADNYASVVSGMGGTFHHPSQTDVGEIEEQVLYPAKDASIKLTAKRLFNPVNIWRGGYIWLMGAIAALVVCFADPKVDGKDLELKIIDCFTLKCSASEDEEA